MKFEVYSDKELLEEILLESSKYQNWNNILKHHSDVYLNMSQADYELEIALADESILFQYLQDTGGKEPIPNEQFFIDFEADNNIVEGKPLSAFFLNKGDAEINSLKEHFGLLFQNEKIDDDILSKTYFKSFTKDDIVSDGNNEGWKSISYPSRLLHNSLIINEEHLFHNSERGNNIGVSNIINFLDHVLPLNLGIEFHLCIITELHPSLNNENSTKKIYDEISTFLSTQRGYSIGFELIFTKQTLHNRTSYSNYQLITLDKGFKVFSTINNSKVLDKNKLNFNNIFKNNNPSNGDTQFKELTDDTPLIKESINNCTAYVIKIGNTSTPFRCYGLSADYSIKNRLINHFP